MIFGKQGFLNEYFAHLNVLSLLFREESEEKNENLQLR
jgi:hypothetical protein